MKQNTSEKLTKITEHDKQVDSNHIHKVVTFRSKAEEELIALAQEQERLNQLEWEKSIDEMRVTWYKS
jgi:hypothetical protein